MKYEILKICVLLIAFLAVSCAAAYQLRPPIAPTEWLVTVDQHIQAFLATQNLKFFSFSWLSKALADTGNWFKHLYATGLDAKSGWVKIIVISLSIVLLLVFAGRAFYQRRTKNRNYLQLKALQQTVQQWRNPESVDIDQAITKLTAVQTQLAGQTKRASTPLYYTVRGDVDSALNHLQARKQLLAEEAIALAKAMEAVRLKKM